MTNPEPISSKTIAALVVDFDKTWLNTRSRLRDTIAGKQVLTRVLARLLAVEGLEEIVLISPQPAVARQFQTSDRIHITELNPRSESISARIRTARAWNLHGWRGGVGQVTCFDEEFHPAALSAAAKQFSADHLLHIHSHSLFLDVDITTALLHHHLHKNHEMRITYTPAAPGLAGLALRADILHEMAEKSVLPWQLLAYDPKAPTFDTLIRDACMQVDPALSKIPNRFCADTDRSFKIARELLETCLTTKPGASAAALATAAARSVAPGLASFPAPEHPRELELELTATRLTNPPGTPPQLIRDARGHLNSSHWTRWLAQQSFPDDLLLTVAGDGDPLLYPDLLEILRAARHANPLSICLQTDLASENLEPLITAIQENLFDVLTVSTYGHSPETYAKTANADLHSQLLKNLQLLAPIITSRGGLPLVVPRLLKTRDTLPELEPFFDQWIETAGAAVIDSPSDRAGTLSSAALVDMSPPKRRPCRRLWDRLLIRANGTAVPCDQDPHDTLKLGNIESHTLPQMWQALSNLRQKHADNLFNDFSPCKSCKEWHRP